MRVLFADRFPQAYLDDLTSAGHECRYEPDLSADDLPREIPGVEILVVRSTRVTAKTVESADHLRLVIRAGTGTNTIDKDAAAQRDIPVCNVPGKNATAVAELAFGLIMALDRNIPDNVADLREGRWNKKRYAQAQGLYGRSLGIVGLGEIGLELAERAAAFGLQIYAVRKPGRSPEVLGRSAAIGIHFVDDLATLAASCDILSFHVPATEDTVGMIDRDLLAHVRPGTWIVNTSRGEIVDDDALLEALDAKGLRAALDVYSDEPAAGTADHRIRLAQHPSVYGTHHIGASTEQAQNAVAAEVVRMVRAFEEGTVLHCVNMQATTPRPRPHGAARRRGRVFNFSAGPSTLPLEVLEEAQREFTDYRASGMALVEMSHRGGHYEAVHTEALELARQVAGAPDDFDVLFVQGGASLQFAMAPLNLLARGSGAGAYVDSGSWGRKALQDARRCGPAYVAWSGAESGYTRVPRDNELELRPDTRYLHITSNETIEGIRVPEWPEVDVPLVADMSSDYLTRPIPWERFDLVYGGVQKSLGPGGMALVFVRRSALESTPTELAAYLRYSVHADSRSLYNTPPGFTVWITGKVLRWIVDQGGIAGLEASARRRAAMLYDVIDSSEGFYRSPAEPRCRSLTNVVFRLRTPDDEARFLAEAADAGLMNLKGHRSVGGCRASLYTAMPDAGAQALADFMVGFQRAGGRSG